MSGTEQNRGNHSTNGGFSDRGGVHCDRKEGQKMTGRSRLRIRQAWLSVGVMVLLVLFVTFGADIIRPKPVQPVIHTEEPQPVKKKPKGRWRSGFKKKKKVKKKTAEETRPLTEFEKKTETPLRTVKTFETALRSMDYAGMLACTDLTPQEQAREAELLEEKLNGSFKFRMAKSFLEDVEMDVFSSREIDERTREVRVTMAVSIFGVDEETEVEVTFRKVGRSWLMSGTDLLELADPDNF